MAWYYGTFSCGCEGRVNVIGPHKDRQWKIDKAFSNYCEKCYRERTAKERELANKEANEKAKEMELSELIGTEKQVAWANKLRIDKLEELSRLIEDVLNKNIRIVKGLRVQFDITREDCNGDAELLTSKIVDYLYKFQDILISKTDASYFINNRDLSVETLIKKNIEEISSVKEEYEEEVISECSLYPEETKFNGIVEIRVTESSIEVRYEKNDTFRNIVKSLNYRWENGSWNRKINEYTGSASDRAAELGNKLLNAGFVVSIQEADIREKAVNGDFNQECSRWIIKDNNDLAIKWNGMNESLYNASRKIPGSKWSDRKTIVKISRYKEVEEFAEIYGFEYSEEATYLIEHYISELEKVERVVPVEVEATVEKDGLNDILNSSREVLDDLVEED